MVSLINVTVNIFSGVYKKGKQISQTECTDRSRRRPVPHTQAKSIQQTIQKGHSKQNTTINRQKEQS